MVEGRPGKITQVTSSGGSCYKCAVKQAVLVLVLFGSLANARAQGCPEAKFSSVSTVLAPSGSVILITHPSREFDFSSSGKSGVDRLVSFGKATNTFSIYLQNFNLSKVYTQDCDPSLWVQSQAGEFSFLLSAENIYFGGGYWELCQDSTFSDVIRSWAIMRPKTARLIQVMDAIYVSGNYIYPSDEFYSKYHELLAKKPAVPFPEQPTATLLELMNIIQSETSRIEVLSRNLPNFGYLPSEYEIQLFYRGRFIKQLRAAPENLARKLLRIEFVETVL